MPELNHYGNLCVNSPQVVSETLEGESIVMHHGTGHYFSATGPAAVIWAAIEQGQTAAAITGRLVASYEVAEADAASAVGRFLRTLNEHGLVRNGGPARDDGFTPPPARGPFSEPKIEVHTDLADMLLLDPIHDVDEAGWPMPAPARRETLR